MKSTDAFKNTISKHLQDLAAKDELFAATFKKENKNIDDCCTYILNQVKASGCNGFSDDEIFGMAVHFYDEDNLKPGAKISGNVVVNHKVALSKEDVAAAKKEAINKVMADEASRLKKNPAKKEPVKESKQASLF